MKKRLHLFGLVCAMLFLLSCQKQIEHQQTIETIISSANSTNSLTVDCGQFRTQSPGGWGSIPLGENPGTYVHSNFTQAFGILRIGCANGYSVTITSAQAITDLLPSGGWPEVLMQNYVDPIGVRNVLVGHLIALTLSLGFDNYDLAFAPAESSLSGMVISDGPFQGMTVIAFLQIANDVIGGCNTLYTVQEVLVTAASINTNYADGLSNNGYLLCPEITER